MDKSILSDNDASNSLMPLKKNDVNLSTRERALASAGNIKRALEATDFSTIRVLEDLIDILLEKDVLAFSDFDKHAQRKLLLRKELRMQLHALESFLEDDDEEDNFFNTQFNDEIDALKEKWGF